MTRSLRRAGLAVAATVLLVPVTVAGSGSTALEVDFARPGQAEGAVAATALQWVLLVVRGADGAAFALDLRGPTVVHNETSAGTPALGSGVPLSAPDQSGGPVAGILDLSADAWSALYVEADAIALRGAGLARLDGADGTRSVHAHMPPVPYPPQAIGPEPGARPVGTVVALQAADATGAAAFGLEARGVRLVRWHNATLQCTSDFCPDAGRPSSVGPGAAGVRTLSYVGVRANGGSLAGDGLAVALAGGGTRVDIAVDGGLRLPDVQASCTAAPPCPDPAGRTLRASGNLTFTGLERTPGDPGRLHGRLAGAFRAAAFDEERSDAFAFAAGGAAVVGALGVALLAKLLAGLFARSARPPALQHPRRRALHDMVRQRPGLSYRGLHRALGWPNGPLQNHLKRLLEDGAVVARAHRNTVRYFVAQAADEATWRQAAQLHDPRALQVHAWLADHPQASQSALVAQSRHWGWSRSATQRLLRDLVQAGLVASRAAGRARAYEALPLRRSPNA